MVREHDQAAGRGLTLTDPPAENGFERFETDTLASTSGTNTSAATDKIPRRRGTLWLAIGLILLTLTLVGVLIASLAAANEPPSPPPRSQIDCSGLRPRIVGNTFVYEHCAVKR